MFVRYPNLGVVCGSNRWALSHTKVRKIKCKPTLIPFPCCIRHNSYHSANQSNILYCTTQYSVHTATFHPHPNKIPTIPLQSKYTKRKLHRPERKDCERMKPTVLMFAVFRYIFPIFQMHSIEIK